MSTNMKKGSVKYAAFKDLSDPTKIKCCKTDELYELRPGRRCFHFDPQSKKFVPKKDYGRVKMYEGKEYMCHLWILDIQDSEEIIKSKKEGGKIKNMSRQSIGNERVLFSEYQLIHEKEVVVKDKLETDKSTKVGKRNVDSNILAQYEKAAKKKKVKSSETNDNKVNNGDIEEACGLDDTVPVNNSEESDQMDEVLDLDKDQDEDQNSGKMSSATQDGRKNTVKSHIDSEEVVELQEFKDVHRDIEKSNCCCKKLEEKLDVMAADLAVVKDALLSPSRAVPVPVPVPSSSRKTITILNAVIGDGDEEVTTYCDLIDDGWVVKDIPKDQLFCGEGRLISKSEASKIAFKRLDTIQSKVTGLATLIFKEEIGKYWLSKSKDDMKQFPEDCIQSIANILNHANRKMLKSPDEPYLDLELSDIREKLKHTSFNARKAPVSRPEIVRPDVSQAHEQKQDVQVPPPVARSSSDI